MFFKFLLTSSSRYDQTEEEAGRVISFLTCAKSIDSRPYQVAHRRTKSNLTSFSFLFSQWRMVGMVIVVRMHQHGPAQRLRSRQPKENAIV